MTRFSARNKQLGVITIFISMILLLLITVLVTAAFTLSTTNLRAVGNVQARDGAIAAANMVIEEKIGSTFWTQTVDESGIEVDIDDDLATVEYYVDFRIPRCVRATPVASTSKSSVTLPGMSSISSWNTTWELDAYATDTATGTKVRVIQGVRLLLSPAFKDDYCDGA